MVLRFTHAEVLDVDATFRELKVRRVGGPSVLGEIVFVVRLVVAGIIDLMGLPLTAGAHDPNTS